MEASDAPGVITSDPLPDKAFRTPLSPRSVDHSGVLVEISNSGLRERTSTGGMVVSTPTLPENLPPSCELSFKVFTNSSKAKSDLLLDSEGYSYTVRRVNKKSTRWACTHRPKVQPCTSIVVQVGSAYTQTEPHCHVGVEDLIEKKVFRQKVLTKAVETKHESACAIVEAQVLEERGAGKHFLPVVLNEVRAINRARMRLRPPEPDTLLCGFNFEYVGVPETFLLKDIKLLSTEGEVIARHMIFATQQQIDVLRQCKTWYVDGTFQTVRKPFYQLFSIHAFLKYEGSAVQVPLVFIIMSRRSKADYNDVFLTIKELVGPDRQLDSICLDYEAAVWRSLQEVFRGVDLFGCHYHFCHAVFRHVQSIGLSSSYMQHGPVRDLIKKVMALPFLPPNQMVAEFEAIQEEVLKSKTAELVKTFIKYVAGTWFDSSIWSPRDISVFNRLVRTNNDLEGYHRRLNTRANNKNHPPIYELFKLMYTEANWVAVKEASLAEGKLTVTRRKESRKASEKLCCLWDSLKDGKLTRKDFLKSVTGMSAF